MFFLSLFLLSHSRDAHLLVWVGVFQVTEMREKNLDLMRQDIVSVLKNSSMAFVRELVGADPVAVFRWAILRAFFRGYFAFRSAGMKHRKERNSQSIKSNRISRFRSPNESILRYANIMKIQKQMVFVCSSQEPIAQFFFQMTNVNNILSRFLC